MAKYRILKNYGAAEGYKAGDVVNFAADVSRLVAEGKVELYVEEKKPEKDIDDSDDADGKAKRTRSRKKSSR